jgi:hypothetical protein
VGIKVGRESKFRGSVREENWDGIWTWRGRRTDMNRDGHLWGPTAKACPLCDTTVHGRWCIWAALFSLVSLSLASFDTHCACVTEGCAFVRIQQIRGNGTMTRETRSGSQSHPST